MFQTTSAKLLAVVVILLVVVLVIVVIVVSRRGSHVRIDTFAAQTYTSEEQELALVQLWIRDQKLNEYGDPIGTIYAGGDPLLSRIESQSISLLEYLRQQHPDQPWKAYEHELLNPQE